MIDEPGTLLIVDDDDIFRQTVSRALQRRGFTVIEAKDGEQALAAEGLSECDTALIDLRMPGMDGLQLLQRLREQVAELPAIMLTGHGSIGTAIDAIKFGAFHYLTKPCDLSELEIYLRKAIQQRRISRENQYLRNTLERHRPTHGLVGQNPAIAHVLNLIHRLCDSDAPVLVSGESGTGKELVAHALHGQSKRRDHPFIAINCATLKPELLENELFGHIAGAFTGATKQKDGLLAVAHRGTLFIDEIADMDPGVQASLLRVIETGVFRPLGSTKERTTDVRIIVAVNRDLAGEVTAGRFRQDLYYRLSVLVIQTPPLRDHLDDIPLLIEEYLSRSNASQKGFCFHSQAIEALQSYSWPGNVRELFNICERALLLSNEREITAATIHALISTGTLLKPSPRQDPTPDISKKTLTLEEMEKIHIQKTLEQTQYNVSHTSDILQIDRRTLQRKMVKYGLREG